MGLLDEPFGSKPKQDVDFSNGRSGSSRGREVESRDFEVERNGRSAGGTRPARKPREMPCPTSRST
jgi:hypothetical protein